MIGWYFGLAGIIIGILGGVLFLISALQLKDSVKSGCFFMVGASFLYVLFSALMVFFGFFGYEINRPGWDAVPVLFFVSTILFVIGSNKLINSLPKGFSKVETKKEVSEGGSR